MHNTWHKRRTTKCCDPADQPDAESALASGKRQLCPVDESELSIVFILAKLHWIGFVCTCLQSSGWGRSFVVSDSCGVLLCRVHLFGAVEHRLGVFDPNCKGFNTLSAMAARSTCFHMEVSVLKRRIVGCPITRDTIKTLLWWVLSRFVLTVPSLTW